CRTPAGTSLRATWSRISARSLQCLSCRRANGACGRNRRTRLSGSSRFSSWLVNHRASALTDRTERFLRGNGSYQLVIIVTPLGLLRLLDLEHEHGVDRASVFPDLDRSEQGIVDLRGF